MSSMLSLMDAAIDQIEGTIGAALTTEGVDAVFNSGRLRSPSVTPAIDIYPGIGRDTESAMFSSDFNGGGYLFTVRARLASNDYEANQRFLYRMMDDGDVLSLAQALTEDESLGGLAASLDCLDPTGEIPFDDLAGGSFSGFQFTLRVLPAFS